MGVFIIIWVWGVQLVLVSSNTLRHCADPKLTCKTMYDSNTHYLNRAVRGEVSIDTPHRPSWGTAQIHSYDSNGLAALLSNSWGAGKTVTLVAAVELTLQGRDLAVFYEKEMVHFCHA